MTDYPKVSHDDSRVHAIERAALQSVEWSNLGSYVGCPSCRNSRKLGHKESCLVREALGSRFCAAFPACTTRVARDVCFCDRCWGHVPAKLKLRFERGSHEPIIHEAASAVRGFLTGGQA